MAATVKTTSTKSKQSAFKFASYVELIGKVVFTERKKKEDLTIETAFVQMTDIVTDGKEIKSSIKVTRFINKGDLKTTPKLELNQIVHIKGRLRRNSWKAKDAQGTTDPWLEEWTIVANEIIVTDDEEIDYSDLPF